MCTVPSAPPAFRVRVWAIMSRRRGPRGGQPAPAGASVADALIHAVVMLGTNDLRHRNAKPDEEVTAARMIAGFYQMALRPQARGTN